MEYQRVVLGQKLSAQPRKEEMAEGSLVNVDDAGKIAGCGLADDSGCGRGQRNCVFGHSYRFLKCNHHSRFFVTKTGAAEHRLMLPTSTVLTRPHS